MLQLCASSPDAAISDPSRAMRLSDDLARFAADKTLLWRVVAGSSKDVRRARQYQGGATVLTHAEVREELETALKLAVPRAWMNRFLADRGVSDARFFEQTKDRDRDEALLLDAYPEYAQFIPSTPITTEEVLRAARVEARHTLVGKGSNTHQNRLYATYKSTGFKQGVLREKAEMGPLSETVIDDLHDLDLLPSTPNAVQTPFGSDNGTPFSETVLRCAAHLLPLFGLQWTWYWAWSKDFYDGEVTKLLRAVGFAHVQDEDPKRFKAMKVDFSRRLKEMDEELRHFANDPRMRDRYDAISAA